MTYSTCPRGDVEKSPKAKVYGCTPLIYWAELACALPVSAVLDGEIVCLDAQGRPMFYDLLYRRPDPIFIAFDILSRGREDLRHLPLIDRKQELRRFLRQCNLPAVLYADHVESNGIAFFERVCQLDLEGIVAKHSWGNYTTDAEATTWFKVRNKNFCEPLW